MKVLVPVHTMLTGLTDDPDLDHVQKTKDSRGYCFTCIAGKVITLPPLGEYPGSLGKAAKVTTLPPLEEK